MEWGVTLRPSHFGRVSDHHVLANPSDGSFQGFEEEIR